MSQLITDKAPRSEGFKKVASLVDKIGIAMMTSSDDWGNLHSRPLATQKMDPIRGEIFFFVNNDSLQCKEVQRHCNVNLAYSSPDKNKYLSISGEGTLSRDPAKIKELWSPGAEVWFPRGMDDPKLCLMTVRISHAEYWDEPTSRMVNLFDMAKALITGKGPDHGVEHHGVNYINH
jgi:general stress protein 26